MGKTIVDRGIIKARNDNREYRRVVLENSLEALLVSDPDTDKCAASMDVGVGHFSDPPGIEGLAHFLEHMLFYASEKYPEEDSFDKYTSQHGGGTNALTGSDHTNYHFVANADCFEEALDRFSQFFVKPLMSSDAVKREIKAVDSEFQKNFLSDSWRIGQLRSHLSIEAHPYHKFGTGNRQTLEVQPKAKGIDIRQELIKFYEENYSANLMHLVVYGKVPLDKIQDLVVQKFNAISNDNRSCLHISGQPCSGEHLQVLVRAVPICDDHTLQVQWPIPRSIHHYKEIPCGYLTHLIGHEGEGSLFHALKRLGWATSLSAYESFADSNSSFFNVFIEMTDAGHAYYAELAGLYYGICQTDDGFELNVSGYNHKLRVLLDTVLKAMADFTVKPERFSVIKEKLTKSYQNFKFDEPRFHASYYRSLILNDHSWPWEEDLEMLETLKPKDLSGFAPTMLSRAFLECYIAGNIERNEAESIVHHIEDVFFNGTYPICKPALPSQLVTSRLITLDEGASYVYSTEGLNPNDENSALIHYIQIHQDDIALNVQLQLLAFIGRHEAFHQLRTVEQLGYVCSLTHRYDLGVHSLQFTVQSAVKCPKYIDTRVQSFLKSFECKLSEMSKVEFENHLNALIESKMEKDKNLWEECERHWEEITDGTFIFDRVETEVTALRELTKRELISFFHEHIRVGAPKRKVLSVRVYGNKHSSDLEADKNEAVGPNTVRIDDIFSFRASQPLYGSQRRGYEQMKVQSSSK